VTATAHGVGRGLTIVALVSAAVFGLVAVMFTAGETFADPGGWQAVGLIASWLVPMIALLVLALARPSVAQPVLEALTAAWAVVALWSMVAPHAWRTFESAHGPVRAVACLALMLPVAALGWHRPLPASLMLLVVGFAALIAGGSAPLRVVALLAIVVGAGLLAAGLAGRGHQKGTAAGSPQLRPQGHDTPHAA